MPLELIVSFAPKPGLLVTCIGSKGSAASVTACSLEMIVCSLVPVICGRGTRRFSAQHPSSPSHRYLESGEPEITLAPRPVIQVPLDELCLIFLDPLVTQ